MTLARTALRMVALAALKGTVDGTPTLAGARVYDSRVDDFSPETYGPDAKPTIIILTDEDEGEALSKQNGGPPFVRMIDLTFEIGMTLGLTVDGVFSPYIPDTDARLEASLDLMEFQIARRLQDDLTQYPVLFRKIARPRKYDSHRQVLDDTGQKIAARLLTWTCEVSDDKGQNYNTAASAQPTGFDLLPEPLRSVANALPAGSASLDICNGLIVQLPALTSGPLRGVDIQFAHGNDAPTTATIDLPQDSGS